MWRGRVHFATAGARPRAFASNHPCTGGRSDRSAHDLRHHDVKLKRRAGYGIKSTAGVVTAGATVMVFVFAIFATLSQLSIKQLGVGANRMTKNDPAIAAALGR
jgi:hypothetical protein